MAMAPTRSCRRSASRLPTARPWRDREPDADWDGALNGTGNDLDNVLIGNSGANVLTGRDGADTLNGGAGADTDVWRQRATTPTWSTISATWSNETDGDGTDTVLSSISFSLADPVHAIGDIENLTLTGSDAINATGNALDNVLIGNSAANVLIGGAGADTLDGGGGVDTASYAASGAGVAVSLATGNWDQAAMRKAIRSSISRT